MIFFTLAPDIRITNILEFIPQVVSFIPDKVPYIPWNLYVEYSHQSPPTYAISSSIQTSHLKIHQYSTMTKPNFNISLRQVYSIACR